MESMDRYIEFIGKAIEVAGVAVIVIGTVLATIWFFVTLLRQGAHDSYYSYRQLLARAILLGLEFLVAGDIIRTVAVTPTLTSVAVLASIVLIRTFLSMTLELELEGRWPWQRERRGIPG